ncbi:unnamed protein product [Notodromas monacha]|uniref:histone deacetylase n=1 Tax=Notodromas monacha TaxID=399045 RepID=A0A7R9BHW3_9CRUS|nr:unnamed protein product [Notodromas monacha]CAG0915800.1 unnamed protein product [Notodromas monacha]
MDQSGPLYTSMYPPGPITDAQVAHARLSKTNPGRPLNRTQSAPLPLKHPGLQGAQAAPPGFPYPNLPPGFPAHLAHSAFQQYDQQAYVRDPRHPMHVDPHNLMKQQLRATVLTRAGSKNHVENVEEETEAAVAQEMGASASEPEVIDLTGGRSRAASYRESCGRSESSSRESDGSDEQQQQQQQRLTSAKSDLERQLLARRAAAAAAAAAAVHQHQQQQQQQHLHHHQHQLHHQQAAHVHNVSDLSSGSPYAAGGPPEGFVGAAAGAPLSALRSHHVIRPLSRALSSPLVMVGGAGADPRATLSGSSSPVLRSRAGLPHVTALAYDSLMLKQVTSTPLLRSVGLVSPAEETGLVSRCERIQPRKATLEEIQICHAESHTLLFGASPMNHHNIDWNRRVVALPCGGLGVDSDTTWDRLHTASAARMAVGCVLELAFKVAHGEASNGFAVVRPPGHHAEHGEPMGFCFFNNVAIAAKHLRCQLGLEKILIIDWDVHHGNGTQKMFYDDCHVLYLSIHRHDVGNFFPGTGGSTQCGADDGMGFTVNVAWSGSLNPPMGDAEYLAAFRTVVIPIAQDFHPDMILVSCGFDAARGHPAQLGGYNVSPACFAHMTRALMQLAHGKVVLALEGGYSLPAICDCSAECVRSLLGDKLPPIDDAELTRKPCQEAIDALMSTIAIQTPHWPVIRKWLPLVNMSAVEAAKHLLPGASIGVDRGSDGPFASLPSIPGHVTSKRSLFGRKSDSTEESETVNAMASLSVQHPHMSPTNGSLRRVASALARQGDSLDSKADPVDEPMDEDPVK